MAIVEAVLALMAACLGLALVARRLQLPYAVTLVMGGMALAFVPGVPQLRLDPELALAFFLPPLLQGSAFRTDWRAFRANLRPILALAVGAVLFTTLAIGVTAKALMPDLPWAACFALGAIVAPPDAAAAAAVVRNARLPPRTALVLEGESLINDASALVIYRFAVGAALTGAFSLPQAAGQFLLLGLGGAALGWAVGRATALLLARLSDTLLETALSFLAAFASYLAGEAIGVSGVIATVACGLVLGWQQHEVMSSRTRTEARATWDFVEFVLNSLVFILIGLQLNDILGRLTGRGVAELALLAVCISAALILSRFAWVFPVTWLPRALSPALRRQDPVPSWGSLTVLSWAGMRGVVSLAAALALPDGFPGRDIIVFLAFCAILATLVLQGLSLPWLIRRLGVGQSPVSGLAPAEAAARRRLAAAQVAELEARLTDPLEGAIANDLVREYRDRLRVLERLHLSAGAAAAERTARVSLRLAALRAARRTLLDTRQEGEIGGDILVALEHELDLEELRLRRLLGGNG